METKSNRIRTVTAGLVIGLVLASLEQTIVATALPTIVHRFGDLSLYSWVFSVYMLASTAAMPIYGKLADLYGRKKIYLFGMLLFLVGSLLCGLAGSMTALILFRGVQGLGAGALMPLAFTIIADLYPPQQRAKLMGTFGSLFAVSSLLGPAMGGILAGWHWQLIFFLNVPIGAIAFFCIHIALQESPSEPRAVKVKPRIDWPGALTMTGGILSLLLACVMGGREFAWQSAPIVSLFAGSVLLLAAFVLIERKAEEPLLPLNLFKRRTLSYGNAAAFFVSAAMFGAIAYIPLFVQGVIGVNPQVAGYIMTPFMVATAITSMGCRSWLAKVSFRAILVPSLLLMLTGFSLLARTGVETTVTQMIVCMVVTGLGMGAIYPVLGTAAQNAVAWKLRGAATASSQFFRSIGGTVGVAFFGSLMMNRMASGSDPELLLDAGARANMAVDDLVRLQRDFSHALDQVFAAAAIFTVISLLASLALGRERLTA